MTHSSKRRISIETFVPETSERTWGTETIVAKTPEYLGKLLIYRAGHAGGLQYHRRKDETFYLYAGEAWVDYDGGSGSLIREKMTTGMSFRIPPGAPHRFYAITDCVVFETSTPVYDDRVRVEEEYGEEVIGDAYGLETTNP